MDTIIKILLISESRSEYELIGDLLAQVHHVDYHLTWAEELDAGLELTLSENCDVVLLDYHWGEDTCRNLLSVARAKNCRAPILVITDEMEADVDREVIRAGASDYLVKGQVDCQLLERTIRYAIERKSNEVKLARLAHYDPLTNIPNRILFRDRLEHAVQLAERDQQSFCLMYLDLDGFKKVNDTYGHDAGDELLRACADRLQMCIRQSDTVARIGGDEFVVLLEQAESIGDIAHLAEKVSGVIGRHYQIGSYQVDVGCSIGLAVYPEAGKDAHTLQKHADMAMYRAKQKGVNYHFFTEALNQEAHQQLLMESDLRRALRRNEFVLHYQPKIDVSTGHVVGLEALVRWAHPERGLVPPDDFIPLAEETGLITPLGYWVIHQAFKDLKKIQQMSLPKVSMAINLSLRQFNDDKLIERIATLLKEINICGDEIEFELTETAVMENMELVRLCLRGIEHLGANVSLDDFGTGYSSFSHLQHLSIDTLKIDKSFIQDMGTLKGEQLVEAMIHMAQSLDKNVVAEGVETKEQLQQLQGFGCDQVQGFYLARPSSFDDVCLQMQTAIPMPQMMM